MIVDLSLGRKMALEEVEMREPLPCPHQCSKNVFKNVFKKRVQKTVNMVRDWGLLEACWLLLSDFRGVLRSGVETAVVE